MIRLHLVFSDRFEVKIMERALSHSVNYSVIGTSTSFDEAIKSDQWPSTDVCICHMDLGDRLGLDLFTWAKGHKARFVFIAESVDSAYLALCRKEGISSLLEKSTAPDHLDKAIQNVLSRRDYFPSMPKNVVKFTDRQKEVLELIAVGKTSNDAAKELGITASAINRHVEHMFHRTGSKNRSALVRYAIQNKIIHV